jgi:hypothetical protein
MCSQRSCHARVAAATSASAPGSRSAAAPVDLTAGDSVRHDAAQPHLYQGLAARNRALLLMIYP